MKPGALTPARCSECGEPASYTGVRRVDARAAFPAPLVSHRSPFCVPCAERLEAREAFAVGSVQRT